MKSKNFSPDYNHNKYRKKQLQICKNLNIEPSDCVIYGITDKNHKRFGDFDREADGEEYVYQNY